MRISQVGHNMLGMRKDLILIFDITQVPSIYQKCLSWSPSTTRQTGAQLITISEYF